MLAASSFYVRAAEKPNPEEAIKATIEALAGWLDIISFVAAIAAAWPLASFIWRAVLAT